MKEDTIFINRELSCWISTAWVLVLGKDKMSRWPSRSSSWPFTAPTSMSSSWCAWVRCRSGPA